MPPVPPQTADGRLPLKAGLAWGGVEVRLNCATDANGRLAGPGGQRVTLSTPEDLERVDRLRAWCDAILVGADTVVHDDPSLQRKSPGGADPMPAVLDSHLRTPASARLYQRPCLVFHVDGEASLGAATLVRVPGGPGGVDLGAVLDWLQEHRLHRLMVEGGPKVLRSFVEARAWDQWTVFQSEQALGGGPGLWGGLPSRQPEGVHLDGRREMTGGVLWTFSPE